MNHEQIAPIAKTTKEELGELLARIKSHFADNMHALIERDFGRTNREDIEKFAALEQILKQYDRSTSDEIYATIMKMSTNDVRQLAKSEEQREAFDKQIKAQTEAKRQEMIEVVANGRIKAGALKEAGKASWVAAARENKSGQFNLRDLRKELEPLCEMYPDICGDITIWNWDNGEEKAA